MPGRLFTDLTSATSERYAVVRGISFKARAKNVMARRPAANGVRAGIEAVAVTEADAVELLFVLLESGVVEETAAVFVMVVPTGTPAFTRTTKVMVAEAPEASVAMLH